MLYNPAIAVNISKTCAYSGIKTVADLAEKLADEKYLESYHGQDLVKHLEEMLLIYSDVPLVKRYRWED
ncbi:hypothetical protein CEQ07_03785 [Oligella urethralis]|uniref:hypothetical protein n=1 Tax=Oligella urethralis TaxID=90245 RepID=UPI000D009DDC|nr:hypothetical protein [Oligella urethralis]AVL70625.1 hypothetical protein CEQ07_03785 [Oligella urethralis]